MDLSQPDRDDIRTWGTENLFSAHPGAHLVWRHKRVGRMIICVPLSGSESLAPLGGFDVRTEYNCFLRYSTWQLLHFTNGFNSLSYPQVLCAIICGLFILTFAWTQPYTPKPIKAVTSKGQGKTLGLRLRIVMTFQTQKLFLIRNILIKCVFGPVSSFAVSTADNLLAQLWLLPRFSTILPNTHTDTHCHLLSHSGTRGAALSEGGCRMPWQRDFGGDSSAISGHTHVFACQLLPSNGHANPSFQQQAPLPDGA